jgi:hypothetical protein
MTYRSTKVAERSVVASLSDARRNKEGKKKTGRETKKVSKKFDRKCARKTRFRSQEHALESVTSFRYQALTAQQNGISIRVPIRAYQCDSLSCHNGWHLTSRPDNRSSKHLQNRSA